MLAKTERTLVLLNSAAHRWLRTNRWLCNAFTQICIVTVKMCSNGCLSTKLRAVLCLGECVCYSDAGEPHNERFTQMEPAPHSPALCGDINHTHLSGLNITAHHSQNSFSSFVCHEPDNRSAVARLWFSRYGIIMSCWHDEGKGLQASRR